MTVDILHLSDTHLGYRQYRSDLRRQDFTDAFEEAVEVAVERDVDAVVHTGDLFDSRDPSLTDLTDCIDVLRTLRQEGIPFYGIVGNHERKIDRQWLDLLERTGVAERLSKNPVVLGDEVAVYGIDSVSRVSWDSADLEIQETDDDLYRLVCMHQLLHPPVPEILSDHDTRDVIERLGVEIDGLALGDYHEAVSATVGDVEVWYAGSTERVSSGETQPRRVHLLSFDGGEMKRRRIEIDARELLEFTVDVEKQTTVSDVRDEFERRDIEDKTVVPVLTGSRGNITANDVHKVAVEEGAAVCNVRDERDTHGFEVDAETEFGDVRDIDEMISQRVSESDLSEIAVEIDDEIRNGDLPKSRTDDVVEERLRQRQDEVFSEANTETNGSDDETEVET
ncbi:MAG: DNA repair exonuclease [Halobacteria archaeon]|nr:DNA repair exonuclease [Halobacteria archaeon]